MLSSSPLRTREARQAPQRPDIAGLIRILADATCMLSSLRQALETQVKTREFVDAAGRRIISLALASVQRMAATLGPATMVTALLADALAAIKTERQLRVSVSQSAVKATRAMLARWQSGHPHIEVQVLVDPQLEPFGCEIESELGRIDLGLRKRLDAIREELGAQASIPVAAPATGAGRTKLPIR